MCSHESRIPKDRLSSLPDEIKSIILSFLPFKQVLQTSILSRPWFNLWTHSQVLNVHAPFPKVVTFQQVTNREVMSDGERQSYIQWVNRVLLGHKGQFLKEFKIVCHLDKLNQNDIDSWLEVAFAKKVQCLELNFYISALSTINRYDNYVFPGPFLNNCGECRFLQFDFKCLKSLSLQRVDINEEGINFFLVHCPFLEKLEVFASEVLDNLVISDPTLVLKYLTIKRCRSLRGRSLRDLSISYLKFLVSLDISAVNHLTVTGLPMLVELFISGSGERLSRSMAQASACFSMLEALRLGGSYLKDVTKLLIYGGKFKKLKRLVICFGAVGDESLTTLISIVNSCPVLEEFVLMLLWTSPERTRTPTVNKVRKIIKSKSLKVFEFGGYYGRFSDVELINLVKDAVGLETIIINPRDGLFIQNDLLRPTREEKMEEEEVRSVASGQYESLRGSIPPHIHLLIR